MLRSYSRFSKSQTGFQNLSPLHFPIKCAHCFATMSAIPFNLIPRIACISTQRPAPLRHPLWPRLLHAAHIKDEHPLSRMHPAHMGPDIRRMSGAMRTVRAIEPGGLSALELEVIVQIVLTREHVTALMTRITPPWQPLRDIVGVTATL